MLPDVELYATAPSIGKTQDQTGNQRVETVAANFADLREVQGMATELQERFPSIHSLVCNAGVLVADKKVRMWGFVTERHCQPGYSMF